MELPVLLILVLGDGFPVNSDVMICVASGTILTLHTLDTKGTVRDARGFASNT